MLAYYLSLLVTLSPSTQQGITLMDSTTVDNATTHSRISDSLDDHELSMRGNNVVVIRQVAAKKIGDSDTMYKSGIVLIDMNTITCPTDRGMTMVKGSGVASTVVAAQRNAWVAMMANHGVKSSVKSNDGISKSGVSVASMTYSKQAWISHYVMSLSVNENEDYVVVLVAYADMR